MAAQYSDPMDIEDPAELDRYSVLRTDAILPRTPRAEVGHILSTPHTPIVLPPSVTSQYWTPSEVRVIERRISLSPPSISHRGNVPIQATSPITQQGNPPTQTDSSDSHDSSLPVYTSPANTLKTFRIPKDMADQQDLSPYHQAQIAVFNPTLPLPAGAELPFAEFKRRLPELLEPYMGMNPQAVLAARMTRKYGRLKKEFPPEDVRKVVASIEARTQPHPPNNPPIVPKGSLPLNGRRYIAPRDRKDHLSNDPRTRVCKVKTTKISSPVRKILRKKNEHLPYETKSHFHKYHVDEGSPSLVAEASTIAGSISPSLTLSLSPSSTSNQAVENFIRVKEARLNAIKEEQAIEEDPLYAPSAMPDITFTTPKKVEQPALPFSNSSRKRGVTLSTEEDEDVFVHYYPRKRPFDMVDWEMVGANPPRSPRISLGHIDPERHADGRNGEKLFGIPNNQQPRHSLTNEPTGREPQLIIPRTVEHQVEPNRVIQFVTTTITCLTTFGLKLWNSLPEIRRNDRVVRAPAQRAALPVNGGRQRRVIEVSDRMPGTYPNPNPSPPGQRRGHTPPTTRHQRRLNRREPYPPQQQSSHQAVNAPKLRTTTVVEAQTSSQAAGVAEAPEHRAMSVVEARETSQAGGVVEAPEDRATSLVETHETSSAARVVDAPEDHVTTVDEASDRSSSPPEDYALEQIDLGIQGWPDIPLVHLIPPEKKVSDTPTEESAPSEPEFEMIREVVHKPVKKQPWKSSLGYMPTMDDFFAQLENDPLFITPLADGLGRQVDELKSSSGWNAQRGEFLAKEKEIADWSTEVEVSQREEAAKMEIERIAEEERLAAEAKAEQERQNVLKRAAEEQELAEQQAREEEARSQTEAAQVKLIGTLSPEWEDKVNRAMETRSMAAEVAKSMGIGLTRKDLGTVLPQSSADGVGWLNDEVVNGFLSAAVARGLEKDGYVRGAGRVPPYHAFNTNFYNNIRDKGPESVLRWTVRAKISLKSVLQTSKVFVPINDHSHWTLLVVSAQDKTIEYLDSLGGSGARYIRAVRSWLRAELGEEYVQEEWAELRTVSARQNNALDCGVFVCFNTLAAMRGLSPETAFQAEDMPRARRMVAAVLLNGGFSGPFEF